MQHITKIIFQPSITMTHGRVFMTSPTPANNSKNNNYYYLIKYLIFIDGLICVVQRFSQLFYIKVFRWWKQHTCVLFGFGFNRLLS